MVSTLPRLYIFCINSLLTTFLFTITLLSKHLYLLLVYAVDSKHVTFASIFSTITFSVVVKTDVPVTILVEISQVSVSDDRFL